MFQPAPALRLPFRVLVRLFAPSSRSASLARVLRFVAIALAASVMLALFGQFCEHVAEISRSYLLVIFQFCLAVVLLGGLALWLWLRALADQHFGLCTGMPAGPADGDGRALTPVLHDLFNRLLGRSGSDRPVVFAELWRCDASEPDTERAIDLQVVTTVLQQQRSLHLPGQPGDDPLRDYFYDPEEWRRLFPEPVMDWLRRHARQTMPVETVRGTGVRTEVRRLLALPEPAHLPVIVAVRLSVSFPGLLSAIPVYTLGQV